MRRILQVFIDLLKREAVKSALVKLLGSAALGGVRAWMIKFAVENLFEQVAEPIIRASFIKLGYLYNRVEGNILVKRINKAKEDNHEGNYDSAIDDIFS